MPTSEPPCVVRVLCRVRTAGSKGVRGGVLIVLIDRVRPYPPAFVLLGQLVESGLVTTTPAPVTVDSTLVLTDLGAVELTNALRNGAWECRTGFAIGRKILTEVSIMEFLKAIETGEVVLTPNVDPKMVRIGAIPYTASNGWRIAIYNDGNMWSYIESVEAHRERRDRAYPETVSLEAIEHTMPNVSQYAPSADIARDAYGIPVANNTQVSGEERHADARAFEQLRHVLAGHLRLPLDGRSSIVLRRMFGRVGTDTVISPAQFGIYFGPKRRRRPSEEFRRLAPRVASELLARAGIKTVDKPILVGLPAGEVVGTDAYPSWAHEAKLVALTHDDHQVKILVRPSPEPWQAPTVLGSPSSGPWAIAELPESTPIFKDFDQPYPCAICSMRSTRFGATADGRALVCLQCGRSFDI